jgi:hypothetical protein
VFVLITVVARGAGAGLGIDGELDAAVALVDLLETVAPAFGTRARCGHCGLLAMRSGG